MQSIQSLRTRYAQQPVLLTVALRSQRPHPGMWANELARQFEAPSSQTDLSTRRLDIILILLRQLLSFGCTFDSVAATTLAEASMVDAAWKDMAWEQEQDWQIKSSEPKAHQLPLLHKARHPFPRFPLPPMSSKPLRPQSTVPAHQPTRPDIQAEWEAPVGHIREGFFGAGQAQYPTFL